MTEPLERLGAEIAEALGAGPDAERLAHQRARVIERGVQGIAMPRRWVALAVPAAAALVAAVAIAILWPRPASRPAPAAPEAMVAGQPVIEGHWLHADRGDPVDVRFSEGSLVTVEPRARLRVARLGPDAVDVSVEDGVVSSRVTPHTGVRWTFFAGPYRVVVVGTRLRVMWEPEPQRLEVSVDEGRVRVFGDQLGDQGVAVSRGQHLEVSAQGARLSTSAAAERGPRDDAGPIDAAAPSPPPPEAGPTRAAEPVAQAAPVPTWRQLAESGRYREAVEAAERVGFEALVASLPAPDLLVLGDAARLSGNPARARLALTAVRERFPGQAPAYLAAFRLGRLAYDRTGDLTEASRWFETVVREAPAGSPQAADARGRLMDALVRSGRRAEARRVAEDYLRLHRGGTYEAAARALVDEEGRQ